MRPDGGAFVLRGAPSFAPPSMTPIAASLASSTPARLGDSLPLASALPFVLLLAAIALLPLFAPHWWEHNKNRALVSFGLGGIFVAWLLLGWGDGAHHALEEAGVDYVAFIALLGSLYVISGGIHVKGSLAGTPMSNTGLLAIGAVLANLIGTTGASMVLIRPFLRANESRVRRRHMVVFFIFVVSNCAGLLTPLGDPPLYLGFLKGVPFEWTLQLWKPWLLVNGALLILFFIVDSAVLVAEDRARPGSQVEEATYHVPLRIEGLHNVALLGGVVLVILGKGQGWFADGEAWPFGVQEALLAGLMLAAYVSTKPALRAANGFTFGPIVEVAILFAGIFATMVAPLALLNARGADIGVRQPFQYFWGTGILSSFLDNAPTYLAFASAACGRFGIPAEGSHYLGEFVARGREAEQILAAISCGAVFMGAMTYIGNGPNFMVKAIAEENGVRMPSFIGYLGWSVVILLPVLAGAAWIFYG
jgi:Na+/H+ antiporter NhaD/arsenite permease-like protein